MSLSLQFLHLHPNFPSSGIGSTLVPRINRGSEIRGAAIIPSMLRTNRNLLSKQNDIALDR